MLGVAGTKHRTKANKRPQQVTYSGSKTLFTDKKKPALHYTTFTAFYVLCSYNFSLISAVKCTDFMWHKTSSHSYLPKKSNSHTAHHV